MLDIQRARWALEQFEKKLNDNPSFVASGTVMKQLLDIYKECKSIDEVMGTRHFDEEHFEGLVEKVKARSGRLGNAQLAMAEHVSRMFSETSPGKSEEEVVADGKKETPEKKKKDETAAAAAPTSSGNEAAVAWQKAEGERAEKDDRDVCLKMLSLMKQQLLKAHADMQVRLGITGGQEAIFSPEDLAETNEEASSDLEGIMSSILGATRQHIQRQLVALFSPLAEFASISSVDVVDPPPTQNGAAAPSPMNDSGPKNMDVDGEGSAAPSGVTSEDISKALYGSAPREASDKKDGDGPEKEKSQDSKEGAADAAAAGPSNSTDRSKSDNNENEEQGKSICDSGLSFLLSVCQLGG